MTMRFEATLLYELNASALYIKMSLVVLLDREQKLHLKLYLLMVLF